MNIIWNIHRPTGEMWLYCVTIGCRNRLQKFSENVNETGYVRVKVSKRTKTTLSIHLYSHGTNDEINLDGDFIPAGCENLKYCHVCKDSPFGGFIEYDCFKLTKKQGLSELKQHVEGVLNKLSLEREEIAVEMVICNVDEFKID